MNRRFRRISDLPPGEKRALLVKLLQKRAGGAMWFLDQLGTTVTELQAEAELDPTIRPEAVPQNPVTEPASIFLTGSTGFLGAFILHELLQQTRADIYCLLRSANAKEVVFRADAAFATPEIYEALEERDVKYAIRLPAHVNLERDMAELLTRPVGRPSHKPVVWYKRFRDQAASWKTARRVVAKVEHHQGEPFPRVGFIVTNLILPSRAVVRFYHTRGTAEQWIKEGKQAVTLTRLRCHRFRSHEVRLWLSAIAYHLGNLWRRLVLPQRIDHWSLTSVQQRLVKTGGRLVKHARYYWLMLAESHLTRRLFGSMVRRIAALPLPAG